MQDLVTQLKTLSSQEKLKLLQKTFSAQELIQILEELIQIDPKIKTGMKLFDCCGTGGDKANTFNISTATAILSAATGIKLCKNGGRSSSSTTGSVDVLEELSVNLNSSLDHKLLGLEKFGLAFHNSTAIAESLAPLKNLARQNKISSFLSLLGPFTNPFYLEGQIIGVGKKEWFDTMTKLGEYLINKGYVQKIALIQSQLENGQVFDELSSIAKATIRVIRKDQSFDYDFEPKEFPVNLSPGSLADLEGGRNHQENAQIIKDLLANKTKAAKAETALLNLALISALSDDSLNKQNIQNLMKDAYLSAKIKLENCYCEAHLKNFLDF